MGTEATHYIMLAIKAPFPKGDDTYEKWEAYVDSGHTDDVTAAHGLTIVADGMNGKYAMIGTVLAKGVEGEGLEMTACTYDAAEASKIKRAAKKWLGISGKPLVYAFTHWH